MAWPGVGDVVSTSPGWIAPYPASTLHGTRPATARGASPGLPVSFAPSETAGSVEMMPATRVSYAAAEGCRVPAGPMIITVPGPDPSSTGKYSATSTVGNFDPFAKI